MSRSLTIGEQHQQAIELLLDFDARALVNAQGQQQRELQSTWFGLQIQLGNSAVLLPQKQLASVLTPPTLTAIPGTPAWILGLANQHGQLLPVVDLYGFIYGRSWPHSSNNQVIVSDSEPSIGFLVTKLGHSTRTAPPLVGLDALEIDAALGRWVNSHCKQLGGPIAVLELEPLIEAVNHWKRH